MADLIQMDYDAVQQMSQIAKATSDELNELATLLNNIADEMEGGIFLGRAGRTTTEAIRSRLNPAIGRMSQKFEEIQMDLIGALTDLRDSDSEAGGRFTGR